MSLDVIIRVGAATQEAAEEDAAAHDYKQTQEDVEQRCGPEGEQVERFVAVGVHICRVLVVTGLVNRVDPHITSDKPAEEEQRREGVPGRADSAQGVGGAICGFLGAGQAGEH